MQLSHLVKTGVGKLLQRLMRLRRPVRPLYPTKSPLRRFRRSSELQPYNKRHGIDILRFVHLTLGKMRDRIGVMSHYELVPPVKSIEEIEARAIRFARQHPEAERIFIRGDTIESVEAGRPSLWSFTPRGHYYPKEKKFRWDSKGPGEDEVSNLNNIEWLLFPTGHNQRIIGNGGVRITFTGSNKAEVYVNYERPSDPSSMMNHSGAITFEVNTKTPIPPESLRKIAPKSKLDTEAVAFFIEKFLREYVKQWKSRRKLSMRFVTWNDNGRKPEFYDLIGRL